MDERRAARIEDLLTDLVRDSMPRHEFETRFNRLEDSVDGGLADLGEKVDRASERLAVVETKLELVDDLEERMDDVEKVTIPAEHQERRRYVIRPMLITAAGILVNAFLAIFTFFAGTHHG